MQPRKTKIKINFKNFLGTLFSKQFWGAEKVSPAPPHLDLHTEFTDQRRLFSHSAPDGQVFQLDKNCKNNSV